MKKNKLIILTASLAAATLLSACGKDKKAPTTTEALTTTASIEIIPESDMNNAGNIELEEKKEGFVRSEFSGEWIDESLEKQRPLCIMINNIGEAMPQSGISQADITYEMLVEGGITRYMCVFKDYSNLTKLGPVRSARHYYVRLASMLDGLYGHVGWSAYAEEEIANRGVNNLNGLTALSNIMYYRDNSRKAPHNVYTDSEKIVAGIDYDGYRKEYNAEDSKMFAFNKEDTPLQSQMAANKVTTAFNSSRKPWFEYNSQDGLYYRFQYGDKQIDDQTGNQLTYKNVIIMFVQYTDLFEGLLDVDFNKGGTGFYITDGEYVPITWANDNGVVKYFGADGNQLKMNPGKTFITVFNENLPDGITIE